MGLVDYSSDSSEDGAVTLPRAKKRKVVPEKDGTSVDTTTLPPLPSGFLDLYSSTVRTSTQDDPALHGGRKRVTPHVAGNWPTHVYLEWYPSISEAASLNEALGSKADAFSGLVQTGDQKCSSSKLGLVHSLLHNELGVPLPLHVSLSRPLVLRTEQKDTFVEQVRRAVNDSGIRTFHVSPAELSWHSNEDGTRWFLVARLTKPLNDELSKLLNVCNDIVESHGQPLLYPGSKSTDGANQQRPTSETPSANSAASVLPNSHLDRFHISIGWSLGEPRSTGEGGSPGDPHVQENTALEALQKISITFDEVKIRVGQDVSLIALRKSRIIREPLFA